MDKKLLIAIIAGLALGSCARYSYKGGNLKAKGISFSPSQVIFESANAKLVEAKARALEVCANDAAKCQAAQIAYGAGWEMTPYNVYQTPVGGVWVSNSQKSAGALSQTMMPKLNERLNEISRDVKTTKEGLKSWMKAKSGK